MQYQGIEEQKIVNNGLLPLARDLNLPLVCTNDVHYLRQADHQPHDILLCIGTGKTVNDTQRMRYHGDQFFLKTPQQMAEVFRDCPDALRNTLLIAERCNVTIPKGRTTCRPSAFPTVSPSIPTSSTWRGKVSRSDSRDSGNSRRRADFVTRSTSTSGGSRTRSR